jgi:hypothetical protein
MIETLGNLVPAAFIAHAGNGIIYHGATQKPAAIHNTQAAVQKLEQRLKAEFDPKHILPEMPIV